MLLRRVMEHVRNQNWLAIAIDFVIVVTGVFIGTQVSAWNTENNRRVADAQYLQRLHAEVVELIGIRDDLIETRRKNVDALQAAAEVIFRSGEARPLSVLECTSIHYSHIYTDPSSGLPTVSELLSSGRFDSLSSQEVRNAIRKYTQGVEAAAMIMAASNNESLVMARKYPELIALNGLNRGDYGLIAPSTAAERCDVDGMRGNQGFKNDLADNKDRFDIYFNLTMGGPQQLLRDLHQVLDRELGIVHNEGRAGAGASVLRAN